MWRTPLPLFIAAVLLARPIQAQPDQQTHKDADPAATSVDAAFGPYIADASVIELLDRPDSDGDCSKSGPLVFGCLIQAIPTSGPHEPPIGALANPFNLRVASAIRTTIEKDLLEFQSSGGVGADQQINPGFLIHPGSRMELVGVVSRIDRQFIHDLVPGAEDHARCGEISLIYRFSYSFRGGEVSSRLPVTMNVVFPAIPRSKPVGAATCAEVASRWLAEMRRPSSRDPREVFVDITNAKTGIVSLLDGRDIERVELNIQAYRISAGSDTTDLGSTAEYVIRVFRWNPDQSVFTPSYLTNEIDRARLLGNSNGDGNSCDPGTSRPMSRSKFVAYLLSPAVLSDIDTGTLNIPQEYLGCRATSASPGGANRSRNALFWDATDPREQLMTNAQITAAIKRSRGPRRQFSFMKSADDVRLRLNELSCTGCHQARAIAGFHFPGADRSETPVSNAVYLPGSPHFYGDQVRRREIVEQLARGEKLSRYELASSYASRPLNKFKPQLGMTQLIGGWGGTCLLPEEMNQSQRQWDCKVGLQCAALFTSRNAPGMGTCVPTRNRSEIGDALQIGQITSDRFGKDRYLRISPAPVGDWTDREHRNTLIPTDRLPSNPPARNSYYGAHQEFYKGDITGGNGSAEERFRVKRDAKTGGFPSGMLRLSECSGLPPEATCGLVASSGFNACLDKVKVGRKMLAQCFAQRTSYAGMRACDVANPCRDDYICLRSMGYSASNGPQEYEERRKNVSGIYDPADYGQQEPDAAWLARNNGEGDQRGICIPPYFVFQFRSDGHPPPLTRAMRSAQNR